MGICQKSIDKCPLTGYYSTVLARLAQLVEHMLDVHGVTGSSPVPRTKKVQESQGFPDFFIFAKINFVSNVLVVAI